MDKPTMWRLDTSPYDIMVKGEAQEYEVKGSFVSLLFNPALQLTAEQAFEAADLAARIKASNGHLLIDKQDYAKLKAAYAALRSPRFEDLELLRRIRDLPKVEVAEAEAT